MKRSHYAVPLRPDYSAVRGRPADHLVRATFAVGLAAARRRGSNGALDLIEKIWPSDEITPQLLRRGSVGPAAADGSEWEDVLAPQVVGDFIASLGPQSAAAQLINAGVKVSMAGVNSILFPKRDAVFGLEAARSSDILRRVTLVTLALIIAAFTLGYQAALKITNRLQMPLSTFLDSSKQSNATIETRDGDKIEANIIRSGDRGILFYEVKNDLVTLLRWAQISRISASVPNSL